MKVGDLVTTKYYEYEKDIVRKITKIIKSDTYGSGFGASADGGYPCITCQRTGSHTPVIDSAWFSPYENKTV